MAEFWAKLNGQTVVDIVTYDPTTPIDARSLAPHPDLSVKVPAKTKIGAPKGLEPGWRYDRATRKFSPPMSAS